MSATATARAAKRRPALPAVAPLPGRLRITREDIRFHSPAPGRLAVAITVTNPGPHPTPPQPAFLRSAPLGAFLPWTPLDVLMVPGLAPGRSAVVGGEYRVARPAVLGDIDKLPPDRLLVALGLGEPGRPRRRPAVPVLPPAPAPATDLLALMGRGGVHWAGNLNLFFPGVDVERHVARDIRVYPGRTNVADFVVGTGGRYKFELTGPAAAWSARLFEAGPGRPIIEAVAGDAIPEGTWHTPAVGVLLLAMTPPADAGAGAVNVHVRQEATGREAVVEFALDPRAAGPGCFVV